MISPKKCFNVLKEHNINFFTGIPDSSLKPFTSYITDNTNKYNNVIAANEGACIALALGYYLATNEIPFVYMQNSGLGNAVNPLLSLADEKVYKTPMLLMIGWRGEPGIKDEPQHIKQGEVTLTMLENMQIPYVILNENENIAIKQLQTIIADTKEKSIPHAIVAKRVLFESYTLQTKISSDYEMSREDALKIVVDSLEDDAIAVATTGKLSRELFEYREAKGQTHDKDFLTVGGMGHSSSIALGIALAKKNRSVYCLDGDGSVLMHTGALATIGNLAPKNYFHIIFNNGAHESVGGQPTVGFEIDFLKIADAFLYKNRKTVTNKKELLDALKELNGVEGPILLEIKVCINSRKDLGRPTINPIDNKVNFMKNLKK